MLLETAKMSAKELQIPPELVNFFLREVQQGTLPDATKLSQLYNFQGSTGDLIMCTNKHGDTPFLIAARHGHRELLRKLFVEYRISLEHTNTDGKSALHEAAHNGHTGCANFLIQAGACVDCLKRADWTPLMLACTKEDKAMVETLVQLGASLSLRNKDGWSPFHIACREGHPYIVNYLLDVDPGCWDTRSNNGRTPLHTIALHGREEAAKILAKRCSYDPNTADSCGVTPLMDAVRGDHVAMTTFLIHEYGAIPVALICQHMDYVMVTNMLASFQAQGYGRTYTTSIMHLLRVQQLGSLDNLSFFTKNQASLDAGDILGRQAIHHAAQAGALGTLECIILEGAEVNRPASVNYITPLHYAAKEGQAGAISLLLQHGADPTSRDKRGRSALDVARNARDSRAAVEVLERTLTT